MKLAPEQYRSLDPRLCMMHDGLALLSSDNKHDSSSHIPFYMPKEFTNIFITVLYIPPSANKATAVEYVDNLCNKLANGKPDSLQIILGNMNRCKLKLPNFTQYVSCNARNKLPPRLSSSLMLQTRTDQCKNLHSKQ